MIDEIDTNKVARIELLRRQYQALAYIVSLLESKLAEHRHAYQEICEHPLVVDGTCVVCEKSTEAKI